MLFKGLYFIVLMIHEFSSLYFTWFSSVLNSTKHPPLHCRLEPVIIELERQRAPVVVISHQVYIILNLCLYCFFLVYDPFKLCYCFILAGSIESIICLFC